MEILNNNTIIASTATSEKKRKFEDRHSFTVTHSVRINN